MVFRSSFHSTCAATLGVPCLLLLACAASPADDDGNADGTSGSTGASTGSSSDGSTGDDDPGTSTSDDTDTTEDSTGDDSGNTDTDTDTDADTDTDGDDGLEADDRPDVTPCPEQSILTDSSMLDTLKTALTEGAITYLDVPFSGTDPDIFPKKCGYEAFWDPADNVDEIPWSSDIDADTLTGMGNSGICGTSDDPFTDPAFPSAGTYRKEMRVAYMATTYHLRWRVEASGSGAGLTYASQGIADLAADPQYSVDGTPTTHATMYADMIDALATDGSALPTVTVGVADGEGTDLFAAEVTILCASAS